MRDFARRLSEFFTGEKGKRVIIAAGLAVIALLFLSSVIPKKEETESVIGYETAEQAERRLEQRLEALIAKIDGAGSATVMVTLDTTAERVYAQNEKTGTSQSISILIQTHIYNLFLKHSPSFSLLSNHHFFLLHKQETFLYIA